MWINTGCERHHARPSALYISKILSYFIGHQTASWISRFQSVIFTKQNQSFCALIWMKTSRKMIEIGLQKSIYCFSIIIFITKRNGLKRHFLTAYRASFLYDFIHAWIELRCWNVCICACLVDTFADIKQVGCVAMQLHYSSCELVSCKHSFHEMGRKAGR